VPFEKLHELHRDADLFVFASSCENMPNVLLEAMAAGLPVVTTAVGTISEVVIDGEHGLVVPPRAREALAAALIRLLEDDALRARMGTAGRERVTRDFDRRVIMARLIGELEAVYRKRGDLIGKAA
jgi:glycosyltransferase involved in cell wall biosynthesis